MRTLIYIAAAIALYFGLKRIAGTWNQGVAVKPNKYFFWTSVAFALALVAGTGWLGETRPGAFFERSGYEAKIYVQLFPDAQTATSYRVPATILAETKAEEDQEERWHSWREYWLQTAFMPNGGTILFEDCSLRLEKRVTCLDTDLRRWAVVLTSTPAP